MKNIENILISINRIETLVKQKGPNPIGYSLSAYIEGFKDFKDDTFFYPDIINKLKQYIRENVS